MTTARMPGRRGTGRVDRAPAWRTASCFLAVAFVLVLWTLPAHAGIPVLDQVFGSFKSISDKMTANVDTALVSPKVEQIVNVLFTAMALSLFVWKFAGFALRGFSLLEIIELTLTIFFVYILITGYREIFPAIFSGGLKIADTIGNDLYSGDPSMTMAESIFGLLYTMKFHMNCSGLDCIGTQILAVIATFVVQVMVIILGLVATLVQLWVQWGFEIAYAVGWVMIPFMLYERLAFLFDGWLKFFIGMIVYAIVAETNLGLTLLGIQMLLGGADGTSQAAPATVEVSGFFDVIGLLVFLVVGILMLMRTAAIAANIVSSAGGGGVGDIVRKAASGAAGAVTRGAGAATGAVSK